MRISLGTKSLTWTAPEKQYKTGYYKKNFSQYSRKQFCMELKCGISLPNTEIELGWQKWNLCNNACK